MTFSAASAHSPSRSWRERAKIGLTPGVSNESAILAPKHEELQADKILRDAQRLKRRIETLTVTREVWVVPRRAAPETRLFQTWCADCAGPSVMLAPEQAATLAGVSQRTIYRWVEAGQVHFVESVEKGLRVCAHTLFRAVDK